MLSSLSVRAFCALLELRLPAAAVAALALHATGLTTANEPKLPPPLSNDISAAVSNWVQQENAVGLSLSIVHDGELVHIEHFGWQDREQSIPASGDTMYRWASISKSLTAVMAMRLWEQGQLDLDQDVRVLVPEFPDKGFPITTRQLLCHQGGIVHYTNGPVIVTPITWRDLPHPYYDVIDALNTFKYSPLVSVPGTAYNYTTHGYILAGAVVQRAGNQWYADQALTELIQPLGMTTLQPDYQWVNIPDRALGYTSAGSISTNTDVSWKLPGGGFISNVRDLGLFSLGLLEDWLVAPATRQLMWTPHSPDYGYGFFLGSDSLGRTIVYHPGGQEKASSIMLMTPSERLAVSMLCNSEGKAWKMLALAQNVSLMVEQAPPIPPNLDVLWDNGPLVSHPGQAAGGADASVCESVSLGESRLGYGHHVSDGSRVADDFELLEPCVVQQVDFWAYQIGSSAGDSTITAANVRLWDGPPGDPTSQVVLGDSVTNRMTSTTWDNLYRVNETTISSATNRAVYRNTCNVGNWHLPPGRYWIDWQTDGSLSSGPWVPPISISGQTHPAGANARQFSNGGWHEVQDASSLTPDDFRFVLWGHVDTFSEIAAPSEK